MNQLVVTLASSGGRDHMLKVIVGAASVATFALMFWLTSDLIHSDEYAGPRVALALDFGVTLAVGYGLFVLAERFNLVPAPPRHRGLLDGDQDHSVLAGINDSRPHL
jgi:hypothetical protein